MIAAPIRHADVLKNAEGEYHAAMADGWYAVARFDVAEVHDSLAIAPRNRREYRAWLRTMPRSFRLVSRKTNPLSTLLASHR